MPHADTSFIPDTINTKEEFWAHVHTQIQSLIQVRKQWVSSIISILSDPIHDTDVAALDFNGLLN